VLDGGVHLSHCPELRISWARDADGTAWALLGLAIEIDENRPDPLSAITRTPAGDVPALRYGCAGRWLLVGGGQVFMDAEGLLGRFYGCGADGETWASSSPALRYHLTIEEASGARIRWREWRRGECLMPNDSFEHEVMHDGTRRRIVLVVDCWHHALSAKELAWLHSRQGIARYARKGRQQLEPSLTNSKTDQGWPDPASKLTFTRKAYVTVSDSTEASKGKDASVAARPSGCFGLRRVWLSFASVGAIR
jgi:Aspartyl/Asparaginyl beta-hydroxylase